MKPTRASAMNGAIPAIGGKVVERKSVMTSFSPKPMNAVIPADKIFKASNKRSSQERLPSRMIFRARIIELSISLIILATFLNEWSKKSTIAFITSIAIEPATFWPKLFIMFFHSFFILAHQFKITFFTWSIKAHTCSFL